MNTGILAALRAGARIKIIGDSIAAGTGSSDSAATREIVLQTGDQTYFRRSGAKSWAALFAVYIKEKFPRCTVVNNGCSGITSTQIRENLYRLYSGEDDIILMLVGANDRKQPDGMSALYDNLCYMARLFQNEGKQVVLMVSNPSTDANETLPTRYYHMEDVNNAVACAAEAAGVPFISHYNYIQEYLLHTGRTIDEVMTQENCPSDGLHPTDLVHSLMLRNLIQSLGLAVSVEGASW